MSLLDIFFPKKCVSCRRFGAYVCAVCFSYISFIEHGTCVVCQRQAIYGVTHPGCKTKYTLDGVFSSVVYTSVVKKLIYTFKYSPHLTDNKQLLIDLFYEGLIQKEAFMHLLSVQTLLMPIPLHTSKQRKRGYNQSFLLARGLSDKFSLPVSEYLERIKNTKTQVTLSQAERHENIKDAFAMKKQFLSQVQPYKQVMLVDDVVTSGATLKEAAKVLKKAGVEKVWGITLAHGK